MLPAVAATISVPYTASSMKSPPPLKKITVVTVCALLTRDLFATAKFLVHYFDNIAKFVSFVTVSL